jgi:transcriptional regulator with XRE-family HTH domain
MATERTDIARALRARRSALGLTRERLADRTGIPSSDLTRWERGLSLPTPDEVAVLAEAIDLDADEARAWLDRVNDSGVDEVAGGVTSNPPTTADGADLMARIADRSSRRDDPAAENDGASISPIKEAAPSRPAPATSTGLVREPHQALRLPTVFPDPPLAQYDPAVHVYSTAPLQPLAEDERRLYQLRRIRTAAILIVLGVLLWWALGSLWEGLGDVADLFRTPVSGG